MLFSLHIHSHNVNARAVCGIYKQLPSPRHLFWYAFTHFHIVLSTYSYFVFVYIIRHNATSSAPYTVRYKYNCWFFFHIRFLTESENEQSSWTNAFAHYSQFHLTFCFWFLIHIWLASGFKMNHTKKKMGWDENWRFIVSIVQCIDEYNFKSMRFLWFPRRMIMIWHLCFTCDICIDALQVKMVPA